MSPTTILFIMIAWVYIIMIIKIWKLSRRVDVLENFIKKWVGKDD